MCNPNEPIERGTKDPWDTLSLVHGMEITLKSAETSSRAPRCTVSYELYHRVHAYSVFYYRKVLAYALA
jgi:hypothetical protein